MKLLMMSVAMACQAFSWPLKGYANSRTHSLSART